MYIDDGERGAGLPTCVLIRELLTMRSVQEAVDYLERTPHAVPNAFLLGHPEGLLHGGRYSLTAASAFAKGQASSGTPTTILDPELATADRQASNPEGHGPSAAASGWASCCAGTAEASTSAPRSASCPTTAAATRSANTRSRMPRRLARRWRAWCSSRRAGTMHLAFGNGCEEPYTAYRFDP